MFIKGTDGCLSVQQVQPSVGNSSNSGIALHQSITLQELRKDLPLERLDELQLATPLELETLSQCPLLLSPAGSDTSSEMQ